MFSFEYVWNHYSVKRRSGHATLEKRLKRVVTFDPTVGSCSNFYISFRRLFSSSHGITTREEEVSSG